jgi:hypothetical protein
MINWNLKMASIRAGIFIGFVFIIPTYFNGNIFNGRNALWENLVLCLICISFPAIIIFVAYWPQKNKIIRLWAEGRKPEDIAKDLDRDVSNITKSIDRFKDVIFLYNQNQDEQKIAADLGISSQAVKELILLYHGLKAKIPKHEMRQNDSIESDKMK